MNMWMVLTFFLVNCHFMYWLVSLCICLLFVCLDFYNIGHIWNNLTSVGSMCVPASGVAPLSISVPWGTLLNRCACTQIHKLVRLHRPALHLFKLLIEMIVCVYFINHASDHRIHWQFNGEFVAEINWSLFRGLLTMRFSVWMFIIVCLFCFVCYLWLCKQDVLNSHDVSVCWSFHTLSLIHIWRCRRDPQCRSRWSPYH